MKLMLKHQMSRLLLLALLAAAIPASSFGAVAISITIAPPVMPVYVQPACPGDGYMWTPGYWAYGPAGYFWVPGVWVVAPHPGLLWTPGYWGFEGGAYLWHVGYWGPHVGFYGGVNYGFGFPGVGFVGGVWAGGVFRYNTAVVSVNSAVVHNVYVDRTVIHNTTIVNRVAFNGPGGIATRPTPGEVAFAREQHFQPTAAQLSHQNLASQDHNQLASVNHGRPGTVAMDSVNGRRFGQQGPIANGAPHGNTVTHPNSEVGQRQANQQQRIAQGIHNGSLNAGQAAHLEGKEQQINQQVRTDRQANGGKLTPSEHQQVNKEQNAASKQISRDKHEK
jgi:WXXGXW repeat (2 copies)